MLIHRIDRKPLLALVTGISILALSACETAQSVDAHEREQRINAAIARANTAPRMASPAQALPSAEAAYKRDSSNPDNAYLYAQTLREEGRVQRASMILTPFVERDQHNNAPLIAEYAAIQAAMGNYSDAERYARRAVEIDPEYGQGYHILGTALEAQGHHEQAGVAFRRGLERWQGDPTPILNNLGLNLASQGFIDEAVETLRRAADLSPERREIQRNLRIVSALQDQNPRRDVPSTPAPSRKPERE